MKNLMIVSLLFGLLGCVQESRSQSVEEFYSANWKHFGKELKPEQLDQINNRMARRNLSGRVGVTPDDISKWKLLGDHFALGMDRSGNALAIYDLSYPNIFSASYFANTLLGAIGTGSFNLKTLIEQIEEWLDRKNDTLSRSTKLKLAGIRKTFGKRKAGPKSGWWKKLKYKKNAHVFSAADNNSPPANIRFKDIDWREQVKRKKYSKFKSHLEKAQRLIRQHFGQMQIDFLDHFELEHKGSGDFDIYFRGEDSHGNPLKIVDFTVPDQSRYNGYAYIMIKESLKAAVSLIPEPVINRVLTVVISRWLDLFELQQNRSNFFPMAAPVDLPNPMRGLA